jgi:predicted aspartyl protease
VIRYSYNTQVKPPAPFVFLTLRNPADGTEQTNVPAQIDLGADQTVLPETVVQSLNLPQMGTMTVGGLGGFTYTLPTYAVLLSIHDLPSQPVKVIGAANEPWVLLGRDVVNGHRLVLDGPQLALEIG